MTQPEMREKQNICRSASLNDLKAKNKQNNLVVEFRDDMKTASHQGNTHSNVRSQVYGDSWSRNYVSNESLLNDLDNMLRAKANLSSNMSNGNHGTSMDNDDMSRNRNISNYNSSPILNQRFAPTKHNSTANSYHSLNMDDENDMLSDPLSGETCDSMDANEIEAEDDNNAAEEQEDEAFANVDEIDGPITPNQLSPKSDHSKFTFKHELSVQNEPTSPKGANTNMNNNDTNNMIDYNMPVDDEFQKNLDRRASEIIDEDGIKRISKPKIDWSLKDFYNLKDELQEWFTSTDYCQLGQIKSSFKQRVDDPSKFVEDINYRELVIDEMFKHLDNNLVSNIQAITYISMGTYEYVEDIDTHLTMIRQNNIILAGHLSSLIDIFKEQAVSCMNETRNLKRKTVMLFYTSTILFYIINTCLEQRDNSKEEVLGAITSIHEKKLMKFLTEYIEYWRWNSRLAMRIRNIILLLFKTTVLQFGDKHLYQETKKKVYRYHGLKKMKNKGESLVISPLHYKAFREDITSRFPNYELPNTELPDSPDDSTSLSQFLEIPRSKSRSVINTSLAVPEKHLATPFPSPPSSPVLLQFNDGMKPRKSFQTNMSYPQLYPMDDVSENSLSRINTHLDDLKHDIAINKDHTKNIPYSVEEAANILSDNLEIKLSTKQLWHERNLFMSTERGWQKDIDTSKDNNDEHNQAVADPFNYSSLVGKEESNDELQIMNRVDTYYMDCLASFNSLIFVLLQTIESNLSNVEYKYKGDPSNYDLSLIQPQLEVVRSKEILMRSCSGLLVVLLKWFKLSHILKFEHLASLIYDSKFITICSSILGKYSETYCDKVLNNMIEADHNIWKECSQSNPMYSKSFSEEKGKYNVVILSSFTYLLKILRGITGNKTHRLKSLPLSIGILFKRYYKLFCLDIYHPILKIIRELTPFKNKRWKSEHMDLISGVYLYEKLELIDNWVTGKDIAGELNDASGQEIAFRALLQFYNFTHYKHSMEELGYSKKSISNVDITAIEGNYSSM